MPENFPAFFYVDYRINKKKLTHWIGLNAPDILLIKM